MLKIMYSNIIKSIVDTPKNYVFLIIIMTLLLGTFVSSGAAAIPSDVEDDGGGEGILQVTNSVFGVEETPLYVNGNLTSGLSKMVNSYTKWARGPEIVWSDIETTNLPPGSENYNWSKLDPAIDELQEIINFGYTPIVVVRGTPVWAQIPGGSSCGPMKIEYFDDFGDFIKDMIDALADEGINVQFWEIWNEPDVDPSVVPPDSWYSGCWGDKNDEFYGGRYYSKMLSVVYPMIKSKDATDQVLVGGLNLYCDPIDPHPNCGDPVSAALPAKFFAGILDDGRGLNFDGVSFHAYDGYGGSYGTYGNVYWKSFWNATGPSLIAKSNYLRGLMISYGVYGKYLMSTETALICDPCTNDPEFEATKANYLADSYASAIAYGLVSNIWFDILGSWGRNNGLVDNTTLEGLPALDAYEHASNMLEAASLVRVINEFEGIYGFEFKTPNPNFHVWMMRSIDGQIHPVQFTFTPFELTNVYGEDISDQLTSDNKLDVSVEPVYAVMSAAVPRVALPQTTKYSKNFGNGDFEDGPTGWFFVNQGLPASLVYDSPTAPTTGLPDTYIPDGDFSAQLGNFGYNCFAGVPLGYAAVEQLIYVADLPSTNVELEFKYIIYSEDRGSGPALEPNNYDRLEVYVQTISTQDLVFSDANKSGAAISCGTWKRVPGPENPRATATTGWAKGTFSLNDYKGQSVLISFRNYNRYDNYYNTISFIDNVKVNYIP